MHFSLCDFLLDLVQNSLEAGAAWIQLEISQSPSAMTVRLEDNGCGMTGEELERARDPFYTNGEKHKGRKVGLGIPFLEQTAAMTEGSFSIRSEKGRGTEIDVRFNLGHVDTPPVGKLVSLFYQILSYPGDFEMVITRRFSGEHGEEEYCLRRSELIQVLGNLEDAGAVNLLRQFIASQEDEILKGEN